MAYPEPKGEGDSSMSGNQWSCSGVETMHWEARVTWRKLNCLNPNLQLMQAETSAGKPHPTPVPFPVVE